MREASGIIALSERRAKLELRSPSETRLTLLARATR